MPAANYKQWVLPAFSTKEGDYKITILRDSITNAFDFTPAATDVIKLTSLRHFANIAKLKRRVDDGENLIVSDIADIEFLDSFQYSGTVNGTPISVDLRSENKSLFEHIFNDTSYLYTLWVSRRKVGGTWEHIFCGDFKRHDVVFNNRAAQSTHGATEVREGTCSVTLSSAVRRLQDATVADFVAGTISADVSSATAFYGGTKISPAIVDDTTLHFSSGTLHTAFIRWMQGKSPSFNASIEDTDAIPDLDTFNYRADIPSFSGSFPEGWRAITLNQVLDNIGDLSNVSIDFLPTSTTATPFRFYYKQFNDATHLYEDNSYSTQFGFVALQYNAVFGVDPNDGTAGGFSSPITYTQDTPLIKVLSDVCMQTGMVAVFGVTQSGADEGKLTIDLKSRFENSGSLPTNWISKLISLGDVKLERAKKSIKVKYRGDSDGLYLPLIDKDALEIEIPFRTHAWSDSSGTVYGRHMMYDAGDTITQQDATWWLIGETTVPMHSSGWVGGAHLFSQYASTTNIFYPNAWDGFSSKAGNTDWSGYYVFDSIQYGSDTATRDESGLFAYGQFYANYFLNDRFICKRKYGACINASDSIIDVQPFFTDSWNHNGAVTTFVAKELEFDLKKETCEVTWHSGATPTTLTLYPAYYEGDTTSNGGGGATTDSGSATPTNLVSTYPQADTRNIIQPSADTIKLLTLKGYSATHSDSYLENQKSDGTLYSKINATGELVTYRQNAIQLMPYSTSVGNTGETQFYELAANGSHYTALKGADSQAASTTYTLPSALPAGTYLLQATTGGVMSWVNPSTLATDLSGAVILNPASLSRNFIDLTGDYHGLKIQAFSSQTNYLLYLESSAAAFYTAFDATGKLIFRGSTGYAALIQMRVSATDSYGIRIEGRSSSPSSSDKLLVITDGVSGTTNHLIVGGTGLIGMNGTSDTNAILRIVSSTGASGIGLKIKADSNSSSRPYVIENSSAAVIGGLSYDGVLSVGLDPNTAGIGMLRIYQASNTGALMRYTTDNNATTNNPIRNTLQRDVVTTDATVTTLYSFSASSNTSYQVEVEILARKTNATAGNTAGYKLMAAFKDVSGTTTQIGTTTVIHSVESDATWNATIDNSGTSIRVRVTGAAANTISWMAHISVSDNAG